MSDSDTKEDTLMSTQKTFTASDRISELNEIDKSVASLLKSAGKAVQILANTPTSPGSLPATLASQKQAFTQHSADYFATLSSIEVRLRRQVYALEEANLIAAGEDKDAKRGRTIGSDNAGRLGGGGPLDASWLNAQAKDTVGEGMERELWAQARALVERLQSESDHTGGELEDGGVSVKHEEMQIDTQDG